MMDTIKVGGTTSHGIVAVAIILSCSGQPQQETTERLGQGAYQGNVAHASPAEGGTGGALQATMPLNPSHISFRFPRVPNVEVDYHSLSTYPFEVTEEGDKTVVTIFPPQGVTMSVTVKPLGEDGKLVGDPIMLTVESKAKLGTYDIEFGETDQALEFGAGVQQILRVGENQLEAPSNEQFIAGMTSSVRHSVYKAEYDQTIYVSWTGAEELRSFHAGPAQRNMGPFSLSLKKGQEVGFYPVALGGQLVTLIIETEE